VRRSGRIEETDRTANRALNRTRRRHRSVTESDRNGSRGGGPDASDRSDPSGRSGRQFVLYLYVALVAVAAAAGLLTGTFVEDLRQPRFLFLVPFPASPLGFAAYGGLTVALALGVPLALVSYVSRNIDE
jgi:hypothetical protein